MLKANDERSQGFYAGEVIVKGPKQKERTSNELRSASRLPVDPFRVAVRAGYNCLPRIHSGRLDGFRGTALIDFFPRAG